MVRGIELVGFLFREFFIVFFEFWFVTNLEFFLLVFYIVGIVWRFGDR